METLSLTPDARQFMQRFKLIIPSRRQGDGALTFSEKFLCCGFLLLSGLLANAFASAAVWFVLFCFSGSLFFKIGRLLYLQSKNNQNSEEALARHAHFFWLVQFYKKSCGFIFATAVMAITAFTGMWPQFIVFFVVVGLVLSVQKSCYPYAQKLQAQTIS